MKKILFIIILVFVVNLVYSQQNQSSIFTNGDKLYIHLGENSEFYYTHTVEKGHTIYSLSRAYNVLASKLYRYNGMTDGSIISLDQKLRIPLYDRQLYKGTSLDHINEGHYIPVYYKTQPKDNIFRISRIYFNQPIEDLVKRNNLRDNNLGLGQDILIGWLLIDGKTPNILEVESEFGEEQLEEEISENIDSEVVLIVDSLPLAMQEENIDSLELQYPAGFNPTLLGRHTYSKDMQFIKKTDVAYWDKTLYDNGAVFALHESALIDSHINVFNPNSRRSVRIKVIGRIPYGTYTNDVKLVLSPRAAIQLGGVDRRFKVEVDYLVEK
ncbi:MAG: LysM repeat protein [Saprospiraceae bacterium]|jgi:LysM repeat protein